MFDFLKQNKKEKEEQKEQERVVRFGDKHNIGLDCYNASDLQLVYGKFRDWCYPREDNDGKRDLAGPKPEWYNPKATMGTFEVFRDGGRVKLSWRDYHDNPIEYELNLYEIFKDKIIPHRKEDEDLIVWEQPYIFTPGIIFEVDDRTLNVYSDVKIRLIDPETNKKRNRRDLILAFSKTF